jgi:P-type E1-E2 ATPase
MRKLVGEDIHLLSGDKNVIVKKVAEKFDIKSFAGQQSPEQKSSRIEQLQEEGKQVLMIGDGVNDAPALVGADVGIALGYLGSNASTDSADIVITVSDLSRVNEAVVISRGVLRNAKQGIFIGIGLSSVLMLMGALGFLLPLAGALLQEVIDLIVIINALRTRSLKPTA